MANDIKVNINVSDGGSFQQPIGNAKTLNKELEQAVANSGRLASSSKAVASAKALAISPQESRDYAVERAVGGGTGASGRDFAKQSQGLGGVVRLYATYAANVFAVGAAFQALNNAAQTTRLFESAQILGDRLGVSMRGLAQDIQSATGYAVSLQDALKFANLGSSVGLASKDIKELTVIAKGAANVLGRDSGDAINRIITGTAKQEQEILDELGIFIKANQAYEAYAKKQNITIKGTAAETLTAQQKVVAYAQEVARAGQKYKEFANIDDPFAEFIAKGKEALQQVLEFVNRGIVPLIQYLNKAEGAITSIAGYLALKLVSRAAPEFGAGIRSFFTFDKKYAEEQASLGRANLAKQYADTTALLKANQAERKSIVIKTNEEILKSTIGNLEKSKTAGGLSTARINTAIFTGKNAPDLATLKNVAQVEQLILGTVEAQLKAKIKGDINGELKAKQLSDFVNKGIIEVDQQNRIVGLGVEARKVAAAQLVEIKAKVALQERSVQLDQEGLILQKQTTQQAKDLVAKGGDPKSAARGTTIVPIALSKAVDPVAAGMAKAAASTLTLAEAEAVAILGADKLATSVGKVATTTELVKLQALGLRTAFSTGLGKGSELSSNFAAAMEGGAIKSLKGFANTFGAIGPKIAEAGVGLTGFANFAAKAGATFGAFGATLGAGISLLGTLAGPLLVIVTLYELFGDKLLRAIGIFGSNKDALDQLNTSIKLNIDSVNKHDAALTRINKSYIEEKDNLLALTTLSNTEFKIRGERINFIDEEIKKLDDLIDKRKQSQVSTQTSGGPTVSTKQAAENADYGRIVEAAVAGRVEEAEKLRVIAALNKEVRDLSEQRFFWDSSTSKVVTEIEDKQRQALVLEGEIAKAAQNAAAVRTKALEDATSYTKIFQDIAKEIAKSEGKLPFYQALKEIKDVNLNNLAGKYSDSLNNLSTSTLTVREKGIQLVNNLQDIQIGANNAGVNAIFLASTLDILKKKLADGGSLDQTFLDSLFKDLEGKSTEFAKLLAGSRLNQKALGAPKEIKLIKLIEDNKISVFEKSTEEQIKLQKKIDDTLLTSLESQGQNKIITEGTFLARKLRLLQDSSDKEIGIAENAITERAYLTNLAQAREADNYAQNLKLTKGNAEKRKEVEEKHTQEVININNAYLAFKEKYEDRIELLETQRIQRQEAEINKLIGDTKALQKAFEEEEKAITRNNVLKEQNFEFEKSIAFESEKDQTVRKAGYEEQVRQEERIYKLKDEYNKQLIIQTDLEKEAKFYGLTDAKDIALVEAARAKTQEYADQIDRINSGLPIAVQNASDFAARVFDFNEQKKFVDSISKVLEDALFNGGKGGAKKIRKLIQDELLKEFKINIIADIKGGVKGIVDAVTGVLNGKTSFTEGIEQFTKIATNVSSAFSNTLTTSFKSLATSDFGVKLGLADTTQTPVKLADGSYGFDQLSPLAKDISAGLGALGGALTSLGIKDLISGGYKTGIDPLVTGATAIAGALFPAFAPLIGAIGGVVNRLFGRKLKDVGIEGTFAADGTFEGDTYKKYKGGLLRSNKTKRKDLDPVIEAGLSDAFKGVKVQTALFATALGLSTDGILGYTKKIKFSTKGLSEEQITTKLQEEFNKIGEEMAKTLLVGTAYNKNQETAVQTLTRLANTLLGVNEVLDTLGIKAFKASLANADLASKLIDLAGGLDKFNSLSNTYYENFYSAQEKSVLQTKNLTKAFDALGKPVPKTRAEFRAMVEALDVTTQAGQQAFVGLLSLSDALNTILPPIEDLGDAAQAAEDKLNALKQATDDALLAVERAIDSQKEYYSVIEQGAQDTVTKLTSLFDLLDRNVKELYKSVTTTAKTSLVQAKAFILAALNTAKRGGGLPDQEKLADAIGTVREGLIADNYKTRFEQERDSLILAGQLDALKGITDIGLTTAEQQLATAKLQLKRLDEQLKQAKDQVDIARGIDVSIKSVAQAIDDLTTALLKEKATPTKVPVPTGPSANEVGGSSGFVTGAGSPSAMDSLSLGTKDKNGNYTIENPTLAGTFVTSARPDQQTHLEKAQALFDKLKGNGSVKDTLLSFKNNGFSLLELGAVGGYTYSDLLRVAVEQGVPRFATGTDKFKGGIRLVGEMGPELENTGPSSIASNSQTRQMLSNDDLIKEIEKLREDLKAQAAANLVLVQKTTKIFDKWDSDGMPEVRT